MQAVGMAWIIRPASKKAAPPYHLAEEPWAMAQMWFLYGHAYLGHMLFESMCAQMRLQVFASGGLVWGRNKGSVSPILHERAFLEQFSTHTYVKSPNWKISSIKLFKVLYSKTSATNYFQSSVSEKVCLSWIIGLFASTRKKRLYNSSYFPLCLGY